MRFTECLIKNEEVGGKKEKQAVGFSFPGELGTHAATPPNVVSSAAAARLTSVPPPARRTSVAHRGTRATSLSGGNSSRLHVDLRRRAGACGGDGDGGREDCVFCRIIRCKAPAYKVRIELCSPWFLDSWQIGELLVSRSRCCCELDRNPKKIARCR